MRKLPVATRLLRLKCSNPKCQHHYTVYPKDIAPGHRYSPDDILEQSSSCINSPSGKEKALCDYQYARERRIEDGEVAGPDSSTIRRWLQKLSDCQSTLSLFFSALRESGCCGKRLLSALKQLSPTMQVTTSQKASKNAGAVATFIKLLAFGKKINFQEHPP